MEEDKNMQENPQTPPELPGNQSDASQTPPEIPAGQPEAGQTPPEIPEPVVPDEIKVEEEWAETLGMDYNPGPTPPPVYADPAAFGQQPASPMQGAPGADMRPRKMPATYMLWSIVATILCCLPAGVAAIVYSAQVSSKFYAQDYDGARRCSRNAEIWIIASIVTGVIFNAFYMPLTLLMPV